MNITRAEVPVPIIPENLPARIPEIIANPPLKDLRIAYSIPVHLPKEYAEGFLQRNLLGMLSQRLSLGNAMEVNYVFNEGGGHASEDSDLPAPTDKDKQIERKAIGFVKKVIAVQRLAALARKAAEQGEYKYQADLDTLVNQEEDPEQKTILELAAQKHGSVAISAIDATETDLRSLGYRGKAIFRYRTLGADYAKARLPDQDSLFQLYDVDTVPATNDTTQRVIDYFFNEHPDAVYNFLSMSYALPGTCMNLVLTSPTYSTGHMATYNLEPQTYKGSPQICFRIGAFSKLKTIGTNIFDSFMDYDTAKHLTYSFGPISSALFATSLTSDRIGFSDGKNRDSLGKRNDFDLIKTWIYDLEEIIANANMHPNGGASSETMRRDLDFALEYYQRQQKILSRFHRLAARQFIRLYDKGAITIHDGEINFNGEDILKADTSSTTPSKLDPKGNKRPFGRSILSYISANRDLLSKLKPGDIKVLKYYLGFSEQPEFPKGVQFTNFHGVLREYFGEYSNDVNDISDVANFEILIRGKDNKTSLLHPIFTQILAYAIIRTVYYRTDPPMFGDQHDDRMPQIAIEEKNRNKAWISQHLDNLS
ncbi:MAG: hypothetical protein HY344_04540 [Candidatus Levybacteria bacterium]|nr:hypothetical protein [Candidatus Levybacteria bacterium]